MIRPRYSDILRDAWLACAVVQVMLASAGRVSPDAEIKTRTQFRENSSSNIRYSVYKMYPASAQP
jgi:hypothetical protein